MCPSALKALIHHSERLQPRSGLAWPERRGDAFRVPACTHLAAINHGRYDASKDATP
jgi:hypothetical protein